VRAEVPGAVAGQAHDGAELAGGLGADLAVLGGADALLQRLDVRGGQRAVGGHADPALERAGGRGAELPVDDERAGGGAGAVAVPGGGVGGAAVGLRVRVGAAVGTSEAGALAADGPGAGTLGVQGALGDRDLLGLGGLVRGGRVLAAAEGGPGGAGELEAAVVAVAGVDGPVAAGLALGDLVPDGVVGGGDARTGDTEAGHDDRATGDGGELRGELDVAEVDGVALSAVRGLATNSGHRGSPGEGGATSGPCSGILR